MCTIIIGSASIILCTYFYRNTKNKVEKEYDSLNKIIEENQKELYVSQEVIHIGEYITEDKVKVERVYNSQLEDGFIVSDDIGKIAVVTIEKGTHIQSSMISEDRSSSDLREVSFQGLALTNNLLSGDVVDVRILYPNGENYIVLSKKRVNVTETMDESYFNLCEEEILRMSSAMVDAYLYPDSMLYTTKYIEPAIQRESIITYIPSIDIKQLIEDSPNIVHIAMRTLNNRNRSELEERQNLFHEGKSPIVNYNEDIRFSNESSQLYVDKDGFTYYHSVDDEIGSESKEGGAELGE